MAPEATLWVVREHADDAAITRELGALHDARRGTVVCHSTPWPGLQALPRDLLRALGKRFDVSGAAQDPQALWETAGDWLAGEQIQQVIVLRAHLLSADYTQQITALARRLVAGARLWLVASGPQEGRGIGALRAEQAVEQGTIDQLMTAAHPGDGGEAVVACQRYPRARQRFPRVPRVEFVLFARACRELLRDDEYRLVAEALQHGHDTIACRLHTSRSGWTQEIQPLLEALLVTAGSPDEALTRLRGAQIALFARRLLATFDPDHIPALHAQHHHSPPDEANIERLRIYSSTRLACAGALALATRQPARDLTEMSISGLHELSTERCVDSHQLTLPRAAHGIVRAHLCHRARQGATPRSPLFAARRDPTARMGTHEMHGLIRTLTRRSHLQLNTDARPTATIPQALNGTLELHAL